MVIYKTTNLLNGKIYIGQSINEDPLYLGGGALLNYAIKKYGKENFKKEIIERCCSLSELDDREKYWIKELNSQDKMIGYNILEGGQGARGGIPDETRKKISDSRKLQGNFWKGRNHTEEAKRNISEARKDRNRTVNPETESLRRDRIKKSHTGKKKSDSHKENIRLSKIGERNPQFGKPQKRKVCEKCGYNTTVNNWSKHKC